MKTDKILKLDVKLERENATPKKEAKSTKGRKRKSRKRNEHTVASGRKLRSNVKSEIKTEIESHEEDPSIELLYLSKDPIASNVSCEIEVGPSVSNEDDNFILMPRIESLKDAEVSMDELLEQSMQEIANNQNNVGRWKQLHDYKMIILRKYAANANQLPGDETSQSTSTEENEHIPKIENITCEDQITNETIKRDNDKWIRNMHPMSLLCTNKKLNPLSLHYTHRQKPYLKCPACGATFFHPNLYQTHLISHLHQTEESYMCNFCNYSNDELGMLFAHLTKHQNQCETCNENLLRKNYYEMHCNPSFHMFWNEQSELKRDHHGMFICSICELSFDLVAQLEKHSFKHICRKKKSYQCSECNGIYEKLETLENHVCLKCPICGEVYETLHRLKVHVKWMKHSLKCSICSYEFILSLDHEKHMALHRNSIAYQPMKDYTHCLRAADGKTFQCNLCDKIFFTLSSLLRHLTEEHDVPRVKVEETIIDNNYELKRENAINIVVVPDFKDSSSYFDNEPVTQETDLYDPLDPL